MEVKFFIETNIIGSRVEWIEEIDEEDFEDCTEEEKEAIIQEVFNDTKANYSNDGWDII